MKEQERRNKRNPASDGELAGAATALLAAEKSGRRCTVVSSWSWLACPMLEVSRQSFGARVATSLLLKQPALETKLHCWPALATCVCAAPS